MCLLPKFPLAVSGLDRGPGGPSCVPPCQQYGCAGARSTCQVPQHFQLAGVTFPRCHAHPTHTAALLRCGSCPAALYSGPSPVLCPSRCASAHCVPVVTPVLALWLLRLPWLGPANTQAPVASPRCHCGTTSLPVLLCSFSCHSPGHTGIVCLPCPAGLCGTWIVEQKGQAQVRELQVSTPPLPRGRSSSLSTTTTLASISKFCLCIYVFVVVDARFHYIAQTSFELTA